MFHGNPVGFLIAIGWQQHDAICDIEIGVACWQSLAVVFDYAGIGSSTTAGGSILIAHRRSRFQFSCRGQ